MSMMREELIVTEIDQNLLPNLKTTEANKKHLDVLEFWEQELYQDTKDDYTKLIRVIRKELSTVYGLIHSLCHASLQNQLEAEAEYHLMESTCRYDVMVLYQLIKSI